MLLLWLLVLSIGAYKPQKRNRKDAVDWKLCGDKSGCNNNIFGLSPTFINSIR